MRTHPVLLLPVILIAMLFITPDSAAQSPHDRLVEITRQRASAVADRLGLEPETYNKFAEIYVREAVEVENLIVSADPDVALLKEIQRLEKERIRQIREALDPAAFDLYEHILEQEAGRRQSRFDSLQHYLSDTTFHRVSLNYFDQQVAPYVVFYHQSYFRPALKQRHLWKINQSRQALDDFEALRNTAADTVDQEMINAAFFELEESLSALKRVRKRYRDELDYISVALGPVERDWSADYLALVQEHFPDDVYQRIKAYNHSLNAYGMEYLTGTLSMVLFDVYNPRSYVESRDTLLKVMRVSPDL